MQRVPVGSARRSGNNLINSIQLILDVRGVKTGVLPYYQHNQIDPDDW